MIVSYHEAGSYAGSIWERAGDSVFLRRSEAMGVLDRAIAI